MGLIKIMRSQLVELVIPLAQATSTRFNFPDQPQINRDGMVIDGLEALCVTDVSYSPAQNPIISEAIMKYSYITLYVSQASNTAMGQGEQLNQVPLTLLHRTQGSATTAFVRDLFGFDSLRLDWSKSYITTGQAIGIAATTSYLFNVYYHNIDKGLTGGKALQNATKQRR